MGVGDSWGTQEQLLHPRDSHGRFRNTWKMAAGVVEKLLATLSSFNPKTFASDQEAGNYVYGLSRSNRHLTNRGPAIDRFLKGYSKVNADLRAGKPNGDAATIDKGMSPLPDDLILSRVVGPEAFGLTPQNVGQVEELTGKLISDKGFSSTNIGTPMPHGAGQITMSIATPKGTKALVPSTGTPTREVILGRDQPLRITKVDSDGQGGFYVYAVASGDSESKKPVDIGKAIPGDGVQEQGPEVTPTPEVGAGPTGPVPGGGPGRPPGPGPGERNDGHVGVVGQGKPGGEGEVTGEVVPDLPPGPEEGTDSRNTFRAAFEEAQLKMPTVGNRRKEFTDAYLGVASGKKTPQQAVNDLDNAITVNKRILASDAEDGTDSGPLGEDIKRQEVLSDLIKEHFNFTGRTDFKATEKTTSEQKRKQAQKLVEGGSGDATEDRKRRLEAEKLTGEADREDRVKKAAAKKAAAKKAVPARKAVAKKAVSSDEKNAPGDVDKMTIPQLREEAKRQDKKIPSSARRKADIVAFLKGDQRGPETPAKRVTAKKAVPEVKGTPDLDEAYKKTTVTQLRADAKANNIEVPKNLRLKRDIFDHVTKELARRELEKRSGGEKKTVTEKVTPKTGTGKPTWGTLKSKGLKSGDIAMYHGQDRKNPTTEGREVRIEGIPGTGYYLVDTETGKQIDAGGWAHRSWLSEVPSGEKKSPEVKSPAKKATAGNAPGPESEKVTAAKLAEERRVANEKAIQERREAREKVAAAKKQEQEAERTRKAAEREQVKLRRDQERETEKLRKQQERKQARLDKQKEHEFRQAEEERKRFLETVQDFDKLTGKQWTVSALRYVAASEGIKIPRDLRYRSEIRDHIVKERVRLHAEKWAEIKSRRQLLDEADTKGIFVPYKIGSGNEKDLSQYIAESQQIVADLGIDPKTYLPKREFHGHFEGGDTNPNHPYVIRDFTTNTGYTIKFGVAVRKNGIEYLVETDHTMKQRNHPYHVARIVKEIEDIHQSLPDADKYQRRYAWNLGRNPGDEYWAKQFNNPNHRSLASAGNGHVNIWDQESWGETPKAFGDTLSHEYGHNVDGHGEMDRSGWVSNRYQWQRAATRDGERNSQTRSLEGFTPSVRGVAHRTDVSHDPKRAWEFGVSAYGKSSAQEDFAESIAQYMAMVSLGRTRDGKEWYFWDLFPERARLLEQLLPELKRRREALMASQRQA